MSQHQTSYSSRVVDRTPHRLMDIEIYTEYKPVGPSVEPLFLIDSLVFC